MTALRDLESWLAHIGATHPASIELGLERVGRVAAALGWPRELPFRVLVFGGTNGKGSAVAMAEAILRAGGHRVGCYLSPHLLRYNERVRIDGADADDDVLCAAFAAVEAARADVPLTYFEYGTLAAMAVFLRSPPDVVLLEVGLGGRLDAVNLFAHHGALITTVDLDHQAWLGPDRESIGREKAGILRAGRPAVCGDPDPPASLRGHAAALGTRLWVAGRDYTWWETENADEPGGRWSWQGPGSGFEDLPRPALAGAFQLQNAAGVLCLLALVEGLEPSREAVAAGLGAVRLPGRMHTVRDPRGVTWIYDVAHNPQSARELARHLGGVAARRVHGVVGMLGDKDAAGTLAPLVPVIDAWYATGLDGERGAGPERLVEALGTLGVERPVTACTAPPAAVAAAGARAAPGDLVVVFGSFRTLESVLPVATYPGSPET